MFSSCNITLSTKKRVKAHVEITQIVVHPKLPGRFKIKLEYQVTADVRNVELKADTAWILVLDRTASQTTFKHGKTSCCYLPQLTTFY